jgi:putative membrane protein
MATTLSAADHARVTAAIKAAEAITDGEVAVIASPASDSYNDVVLHWALLLALLPLALAAAWPGLLLTATAAVDPRWGEMPSLQLALTLLLAVVALAFLAGRFLFGLPPLRAALTPGATKTRRVRRRAITLFRAGTEARTAARTGVLLYLSLAERRAEIVADSAIHQRVGAERWGEAMAALIGPVRDGRPGEGIAAAVERIGAVLAEQFPWTGTDPNELADTVIEL